jgi:hypothetical protein
VTPLNKHRINKHRMFFPDLMNCKYPGREFRLFK